MPPEKPDTPVGSVLEWARLSPPGTCTLDDNRNCLLRTEDGLCLATIPCTPELENGG